MLNDTLPLEEWRPVVGYEGWYEVSSLGRVRRIRGLSGQRIHRLLKPSPCDSSSHLQVGLWRGNRRQNHFVHRLMAMAFFEEPPADQHLVRHLNDIGDDNRLENIAWGTYQDNSDDCRKNGKQVAPCGSSHGHSKLTEVTVAEIRRRVAAGEKQKAVAAEYGVCPTAVSHIVAGRRWREGAAA